MKKTLRNVVGTIAGLAVVIVLLGSVVVTNENEFKLIRQSGDGNALILPANTPIARIFMGQERIISDECSRWNSR